MRSDPVGITKRQLPIASPCRAFAGRPATADAPAFCTNCDKAVHDLSRLSEDEVVTLLARHRKTGLCVSYRTRPDGTIRLRAPAPRFAPAALAVSLAGCAGHMPDAERSAQSECIDADGYAVVCPPKPRLADAVIPEDEPVEPAVQPSEAGVVPPLSPFVEPIETDPARGFVAVEAPVGDPEVDDPDVDDVVGIMEVDVEVEPLGKPRIDPKLARRIAREEKRLAREERREARRLARR